ncbi:potassium-transporting ATPase subunit KdpA, partial [Yersinia enterocolitica]
MAASGFLLIASFMLVLLVLARPLGSFLARLIEGDSFMPLQKIEAGLWRCSGVKNVEMNGWQYALAILLFNILGIALLFALLMMQGSLPLNPENMPGMSWHLA